ncbi:protein phosphatase CheZ [Labrenzia sp. R4_1]|jgi:chemotaxis protein CheZ|uniref:protein phosphatase CheZ n=1 Tax=Stappiaceae TaxID=2821832 RepID=UPI0010EA40F8|nr:MULTISPECIES: protein phosphatase CheZ [unclassified Labrenzia]MBO9420669.1 protein phosphatase CheZ [Labrenzia sp. R4_2]MBO9423758.1 protein phosphatase CheZ [Labrenzia sp. R4_1]
MDTIERLDLMAKIKQENVAQIIDFLEQNKTRDGEVSLNDVMHLAEVMSGSMHDFLSTVQPAVTEELTAIAKEITRMKQEISALRANDMTGNKIPDAGRELDAIVEATENATNTIMEAAEEIMAADPSDSEAYQDLVSNKMIGIFEACTFQDITGQRISKVVETLRFIDERVTSFIEQLRIPASFEAEIEETDEERRKRELILHGPQHSGEGVSQNDIDALLGDSQADIDKLFD